MNIVSLDILHRSTAVGAGLELGVSVLVRGLGDVTQLQQMRSGVLGQDGAGLIGDLEGKTSETTQLLGELEGKHFWFRK